MTFDLPKGFDHEATYWGHVTLSSCSLFMKSDAEHQVYSSLQTLFPFVFSNQDESGFYSCHLS